MRGEDLLEVTCEPETQLSLWPEGEGGSEFRGR